MSDLPALRIGDPAMDAAQGRPMVVVDTPDLTVAEWSEANDYDLTTNYGNEKFGAAEEEDVVTAVYVSDVRSEPSKDYTFPRSRLRLIDAHHADGGRRIYDRIVAAVLEQLIAAGREYDGTDHCAGPAELARDAGIDEEIVEEARELTEVEAVIGGDADD